MSALIKPSRHHSACPWDFQFLALWVDILCHPNNPIRHWLFLSNTCGVSPHQAIEASMVLLVLGISGFFWVDVLHHPNDLIKHHSFLSNACGVSLCQTIKAFTVLLVFGILVFLHFGLTSYIALMTQLGITCLFPTLVVSVLIKPLRHPWFCLFFILINTPWASGGFLILPVQPIISALISACFINIGK